MNSIVIILALTSSITFAITLTDQNIEDVLEQSGKIATNKILWVDTHYNECGGVIPLTPIYDSYIHYKLGQSYDNNEFCVWILMTSDDITSVTVSVTQNIADGSDGLTAYFLNSTGLISYRLPGDNITFEFNTPLAILAFSTRYGVGEGFSIKIQSTGEHGRRSSGAYHVKKDAGDFTFPYEDDRVGSALSRLAIVVQRKTVGLVEKDLKVKLRNVDVGETDAILVYTLNHGRLSPDIALIGRFTSDADFEVSAFYPMLILLETKTTLEEKGFKLNWKEFQYCIQ